MGTASMIGIYNEDGSVTATYCHYDGYLEYMGRMLTETYNTPKTARMVAECGYLSSLEYDFKRSLAEAVHKNESAVPYESVEQFMKNGYDYAGAEYLYLFDGETWFFACKYSNTPKFEEVEINLKKVA